MQEMRIGDVEIISILMPCSDRMRNIRLATPRWVFIPAPTSDTFAMFSSTSTPSAPTVIATLSVISRAFSIWDRGTVKLMSVTPLIEDVLHDHVDVHTRRGQRLEQTGGDTGLVRNAVDGHLRLRRVVSDPADDRFFHNVLLDHGAGLVVERRPDVYRDLVSATELNGSSHEDPGPCGGKLEHLLERDLIELLGVGDKAGVGREHPVHIRVDLTFVCSELCRQRDSGGVGPTASQGRDLLGDGIDALKTRRRSPPSPHRDPPALDQPECRRSPPLRAERWSGCPPVIL